LNRNARSLRLLHPDERHVRFQARMPKRLRPRHAPNAECLDRTVAEHQITCLVPRLAGFDDDIDRVESIERYAFNLRPERILHYEAPIREPVDPAEWILNAENTTRKPR